MGGGNWSYSSTFCGMFVLFSKTFLMCYRGLQQNRTTGSAIKRRNYSSKWSLVTAWAKGLVIVHLLLITVLLFYRIFSWLFNLFIQFKVDMSKVKLDVIKPWIQEKITEILRMDDDVVVEFIYNQLEVKVWFFINFAVNNKNYIGVIVSRSKENANKFNRFSERSKCTIIYGGIVDNADFCAGKSDWNTRIIVAKEKGWN